MRLFVSTYGAGGGVERPFRRLSQARIRASE